MYSTDYRTALLYMYIQYINRYNYIATQRIYNLNDSMTALRKSVCVPFSKDKVEPDDKSTLTLILLYTTKEKSFSSETVTDIYSNLFMKR